MASDHAHSSFPLHSLFLFAFAHNNASGQRGNHTTVHLHYMLLMCLSATNTLVVREVRETSTNSEINQSLNGSILLYELHILDKTFLLL